MKFTTVAVCALIACAPSAFAQQFDLEKADSAMAKLDRMGYSEIRLVTNEDKVVIFAEKSNKMLSMTYDRDMNLIKRRFVSSPTKVAGEKGFFGTLMAGFKPSSTGQAPTAGDDNDAAIAADQAFGTRDGRVVLASKATVARLGEAEADTDSARDTLKNFRERDLGPDDIKEAETDFEDLEAEEDGIRAALKDTDKKSGSKPSAPAVVEARLDRAENETDAARETLKDFREKGLGAEDIKEAEIAFEEAEAEEDAIREKLNEAKDEAQSASKPKVSQERLDRAEKETDAARDDLAKGRAKGWGPQDIKELETAFEEAEAEEDALRELSK